MPEDYLGDSSSITVIDFWRLMSNKLENHPQIRYVPIGRCIDNDLAIAGLARVWAAS